MKICGICKKNPIPEWHHAYCRECYRQMDRRRYYKSKEKRLAKDKKYYEENKAKWIDKFKKERDKSPEKVKARQDLRNAIAQGKIKRMPCEVCGKKRTHAHHTDYSKPFDVMWLCVEHHYEKHRKYKLGS